MQVISGCLGGICCRYDGRSNTIDGLKTLLENGDACAICPEVLGDLPTPRSPAEIVGGDGFDVWQGTAQVMTKDGRDVTEAFKAGAIRAYEEIKNLEFSQIILKTNSPSCGSKLIYDGTFSGEKIPGVGVTTAYFINQGLKVISEAEWGMSDGT